MHKKKGKVLKIAAISFVALLTVIAVIAVVLIRNPWPEYSGNLKVEGLDGSVKVIRDEWGVPNIYADNEHDLFFAQGFVHAQDRLWQMEIYRRLCTGTLSEVVGPVGISKDKEARLYGFYNIALLTIPQLDSDVLNIIQSYCDGINAYIRDNQNSLPIEFAFFKYSPAEWTPADVLAWGNFISFGTAQNWRYETFRSEVIKKLGSEAAHNLLPPTEAEGHPLIVPEENLDILAGIGFEQSEGFEDMFPGINTIGLASGAWAISGEHTETGNALLSSDAHLNLGMPSMWIENGLHAGRFEVTGFSFPGFPFVLIGHNDKITWGFTNMNPDVHDLYIEKLDDRENPTQYLFQNEWKDVEVREEVIHIKGEESLVFEVISTQHGPLMGELVEVTEDSKFWEAKWTGENDIALNCPTHEGSLVISSIYKLNLAQNWEQFRESLRDWDTLSQNFIYADNSGNIGYQAAGKVPIRVEDHLGIVPVPGWTGESEWLGFIPYDELPYAYNPEQGFLVAANNKMVSDDYPYKFTYDYFHPGYRARRINQLITDLIDSEKKITIEDMHSIQSDTFSEHSTFITPYLLQLEVEDETERVVLDYISEWDHYFDSDSIAAGMYMVWYQFFKQNLFNDELIENEIWGPFMPMKQHLVIVELIDEPNSVWYDDVTTENVVEDRDDMIRKSLDDAITWLSDKYGNNPENWNLATVQTASLVDPIFGYVPVLKNIYNSKPLPFRGSSISVSFAWSFTIPPNDINIQFASTQRQIIDCSDWDSMLAINSSGQNGHLYHKNRLDQIPLWANEELRTMSFSETAIESGAVNTLIMEGISN